MWSATIRRAPSRSRARRQRRRVRARPPDLGSQRIRQSPFPVVAAPFGLTLGGGCEFSLHADRVQAHAELYMGLVEVGVGLIPAGGGTTEMLFRFSSELAPYAEADPFEAVRRAFQLIAMATTSTSALEARRLGYSARARPNHDESRSADRRRGGAGRGSRARLRRRRFRERSPRWERTRSEI